MSKLNSELYEHLRQTVQRVEYTSAPTPAPSDARTPSKRTIERDDSNMPDHQSLEAEVVSLREQVRACVKQCRKTSLASLIIGNFNEPVSSYSKRKMSETGVMTEPHRALTNTRRQVAILQREVFQAQHEKEVATTTMMSQLNDTETDTQELLRANRDVCSKSDYVQHILTPIIASRPAATCT